MKRFKQKINKFMQGRYGMDILSRDLSWLILAILITNLFIRSMYLNILALLLFVIIYYRMLSKRFPKRYNENRIYANFKMNTKRKFNKTWRRLKDVRKYKYFNCPQCNQTLRVPRGKKEITITCSRCKTKFDGKT